jgi:hypothetical protein
LLCQDNYITLYSTTPSRSGLFAVNLPGVESGMLELLKRADQDEVDELWDLLYTNAWNNLIGDVTAKLQGKFYVDTKILSRETSQFKANLNSITGLAGVKITFSLPRYAKIHIVSVDVQSDSDYDSPEGVVQVYDTDGDLLSEDGQALTEGKNTIFIDRDYDACSLFVAYDPEVLSFKSTENKRYNLPYTDFSCDCCTFCYSGSYMGTIEQFNGGGLNVKYNVFCSIDKYVCENINLFRQSLYYRIGLEIMAERRFGFRLNKYTTMTLERQQELWNFYSKQYENFLGVALDSQQLQEDPYCFKCQGVVGIKSEIP